LATLLKELAERGQASYRNHTRMAIAKFEELLHMFMTKVHKNETVFGTLIPAIMKGELTFQYLASGSSSVSLQYAFRISENTKVSTKVMPPFFLM
jgi:hypothetical protein